MLPSELRQAVSGPGGGKITLVLGAGSSFEPPTSIPLGGTCSHECHDRLVADGVLAIGDCLTPSNLSSLADAVFAKTGQQRPLVEQLSRFYNLKSASPNQGHLHTAALMREGAITSVVTLNFDLALSIAIGQIGVGDVVGIVDGPNDFGNQKTINLYYLHRNANEVDSETWILRTSVLKTEWEGKWEAVLVNKVLATPVVVFAGLGSPADVLIESSKLIQKALNGTNKVFQVDPDDMNKSEFFKALKLDPASYIPMTWCDFMESLSQRLLQEHLNLLKSAAESFVARENLVPEDLTVVLGRLKEIGLLGVGSLRANWLLHGKVYCPESENIRELIADLLLAAAMIARVTNTTAVLFNDGIVELRRGDRTIATYMFVSGKGSHSCRSIEAELSERKKQYRYRPSPPAGAIIAGTIGNYGEATTPPRNLLLGETSGDIVLGPSTLQMFHVESLRQDLAQCLELAP